MWRDGISYINNNSAEVKLKDGVPLQGNIMNLHVMFEDDEYSYEYHEDEDDDDNE